MAYIDILNRIFGSLGQIDVSRRRLINYQDYQQLVNADGCANALPIKPELKDNKASKREYVLNNFDDLFPNKNKITIDFNQNVRALNHYEANDTLKEQGLNDIQFIPEPNKTQYISPQEGIFSICLKTNNKADLLTRLLSSGKLKLTAKYTGEIAFAKEEEIFQQSNIEKLNDSEVSISFKGTGLDMATCKYMDFNFYQLEDEKYCKLVNFSRKQAPLLALTSLPLAVGIAKKLYESEKLRNIFKDKKIKDIARKNVKNNKDEVDEAEDKEEKINPSGVEEEVSGGGEGGSGGSGGGSGGGGGGSGGSGGGSGGGGGGSGSGGGTPPDTDYSKYKWQLTDVKEDPKRYEDYYKDFKSVKADSIKSTITKTPFADYDLLARKHFQLLVRNQMERSKKNSELTFETVNEPIYKRIIPGTIVYDKYFYALIKPTILTLIPNNNMIFSDFTENINNEKLIDVEINK
ncbi:MAG: hypothetical protein KKA19_06605, partial [Candidatus Margulisbacteria bacterium]|nr:hypothetical protein [Candidatus Margulisiibacteriota bacterium]